MKTLKTALLAATATIAWSIAHAAAPAPTYQHVLLVSVDGLHAIDLQTWVGTHPAGALAALSRHGVSFPNAYTTAPSDSFPGMIAQISGATPRTAGVFYDDSFDRTLFAPGSDCTGDAGAEVTYAENLDVDQSLASAGGTLGQPLTQIDPAKLPRHRVLGRCLPVYPHQFIKTNTLFEIIKAAGLRTAWCDKHPAYEILNGPSGHGIDDLFTPEINSRIPGAPATVTGDNTSSYSATRANDERKVQAVLNEIGGFDSVGAHAVGVPAILGMNFQSVSVGQKLAHAGYGDATDLVGGYTDARATPGNALTLQLAYVDDALGRMTAALHTAQLDGSTLVIVSAKHAQSPIDRTLRIALDDGPYAGTPGYGFHIADDVALIWLKPQTRAANVDAARAYLLAHADELGIAALLDPTSLATVYRHPRSDTRTPDFIAVPRHGVIYTGGSKLSEHGGLTDDDRNVGLLISAPKILAAINPALVETRQIAPTILSALGLDPTLLDGVRREGTAKLPF